MTSNVAVFSWQAPLSTPQGVVPTFFREVSPSEAALLQSSRLAYPGSPPFSSVTPGSLPIGRGQIPTTAAATATPSQLSPIRPQATLLSTPVSSPSVSSAPSSGPAVAGVTATAPPPVVAATASIAASTPSSPASRDMQDIIGQPAALQTQQVCQSAQSTVSKLRAGDNFDIIPSIIGSVTALHAKLQQKSLTLSDAIGKCGKDKASVGAAIEGSIASARQHLENANVILGTLDPKMSDFHQAVFDLTLNLSRANRTLRKVGEDISELCPDTDALDDVQDEFVKGGIKYEELAVPRKLVKFFYHTPNAPGSDTQLLTNKKILQVNPTEGRQLLAPRFVLPVRQKDDLKPLLKETAGWKFGDWTIYSADFSSPKDTFVYKWATLAALDQKKTVVEADTYSRLYAAVDYMLDHIRAFVQEFGFVPKDEWDKVFLNASHAAWQPMSFTDPNETGQPAQAGVLLVAFGETLVGDHGIIYDSSMFLQSLQVMDSFYNNIEEPILWLGMAKTTTWGELKRSSTKLVSTFGANLSQATKDESDSLFSRLYNNVSSVLSKLPVIPSVYKFVVNNSFSLLALIALAWVTYYFGGQAAQYAVSVAPALQNWFNGAKILWQWVVDAVYKIWNLICGNPELFAVSSQLAPLWSLYSNKVPMSKTVFNVGTTLASANFLGWVCSKLPTPSQPAVAPLSVPATTGGFPPDLPPGGGAALATGGIPSPLDVPSSTTSAFPGLTGPDQPPPPVGGALAYTPLTLAGALRMPVTETGLVVYSGVTPEQLAGVTPVDLRDVLPMEQPPLVMRVASQVPVARPVQDVLSQVYGPNLPASDAIPDSTLTAASIVRNIHFIGIGVAALGSYVTAGLPLLQAITGGVSGMRPGLPGGFGPLSGLVG